MALRPNRQTCQHGERNQAEADPAERNFAGKPEQPRARQKPDAVSRPGCDDYELRRSARSARRRISEPSDLVERI